MTRLVVIRIYPEGANPYTFYMSVFCHVLPLQHGKTLNDEWRISQDYRVVIKLSVGVKKEIAMVFGGQRLD
jgi:hypothetical protein